MKRYKVLCILLFLSLIGVANEKGDWELSKQGEGISVYFRMISKSQFEIRVQTVFKTKEHKLSEVIYDVPSYPKWVYNCKSAKAKTINNKPYLITVTDLPWPLKDREVVNKIHKKKQIDSETILIRTTTEPNAIPLNSKLERVSHSNVSWMIKTIAPDKIEIDYRLSLKINQDAPEFILKMIVSNGPFETFKNLKQLLSS